MVGDNLLNSAFATRPDVIRHLNGFLSIDMYSATLPATSKGKKARKAFHKLFDTRESSYPASGYEGMILLQNAMNHCLDSSEADCLNTTIQNTVNFPGLMGNITILPGGKSMRPLIVNRIQGNRLEFMVKVY
jgi:ABC-type branched-subunit amino acid transport system substrate-binding protein